MLTKNTALGAEARQAGTGGSPCWTLVFPLIANSWGWIFTETGRQPWVVYGVLQTRDAVSPGVSQGEVLTSLIVFTLLYAVARRHRGQAAGEVRQGRAAGAHRGRPQPAHQDRRRHHDDADRPMAFSY